MGNNNENSFSKISYLNKEFDFDIVKSVMKKNWFVIPIVLIMGLSIAFIFLRYSKPIYQSSAIIQRTSKDEGKKVLEISNFEQE